MTTTSQHPIFLLSTGRCGSTFLSEAINRHAEIVSISELFEPVFPVPYFQTNHELTGARFFELLASPTLEERIDLWEAGGVSECLFLPEDRSMASLLLCYTLPALTDQPMVLFRELEQYFQAQGAATPKDHLLALFQYLMKAQGKQRWVERTGGSITHINTILETFPNARIIHVFRDGRNTALSMSKHPVFDLFVRSRGEHRMANGTFPVAAFGRMWSDWELQALRAMERLPAQNVLHISYDRLLGNPKTHLAQVVQFIQESTSLSAADRTWIDAEAATVMMPRSNWEKLDDAAQRRLADACEAANAKLNALANA